MCRYLSVNSVKQLKLAIFKILAYYEKKENVQSGTKWMFYFSDIRIGFLCIDSAVSWNVFIGFRWKSPVTCHVFYEEKKAIMLKIPLVLEVCELEFMFTTTTWKLWKWFLLKYIAEKHTFAAINKVLFRQGHQFSSFTEMLSFQCSCSWKCPTGSTLSLKKEPRENKKKSRIRKPWWDMGI